MTSHMSSGEYGTKESSPATLESAADGHVDAA